MVVSKFFQYFFAALLHNARKYLLRDVLVARKFIHYLTQDIRQIFNELPCFISEFDLLHLRLLLVGVVLILLLMIRKTEIMVYVPGTKIIILLNYQIDDVDQAEQ